MLAVFNKELRYYFNSVTGYIFMGAFLLISGIFFVLTNLAQSVSDYNGLFGSITFIFLLLVPVLTMRIVAEETHQKTDQLLLTSPLSVTQIIVGKYLAACTMFLITLSITLIYPFILSFFGTVPLGTTVGGYFGFLLLGASFISVGIFVSSLTENQIASAVGTFAILLLIWILDWIEQSLPTTQMSSLVFIIILIIAIAAIIYFSTRNNYVSLGVGILGTVVTVVLYLANKASFEGLLPKIVDWISLVKRYNDFSLGVFNLNSIIYYISFSIVFVLLSIRMIDKRRWS